MVVGALVSPLLQELLVHPFPRMRSRVRSVDFYDYISDNYVGLRMIDHVVDFETHEKNFGRERAESIAELEWV